MTDTTPTPPDAPPPSRPLPLLLTAAGLVFFWLLAFQGRDGVTPHGWGSHALALRLVALEHLTPYAGNFLHTEGHLYLYTAVPLARLSEHLGLGLWGITLYSRLVLSLLAVVVALWATAAKLGPWARGLLPLTVLFHPFVLELAMGYEGMADALFYLSLAGLGLLRGNGVLTGAGVVLAAACRGGTLPHGLLLTTAFLLLHPRGWRVFLPSVLAATALAFGPVWAGNLEGWRMGVVTHHLVKVYVQPLLPLMVAVTQAAVTPMAALILLWRGYTTSLSAQERKPPARVWAALVLLGFAGPLLCLGLFLRGHLVLEIKAAPTLLLMALGAVLLTQQSRGLGFAGVPRKGLGNLSLAAMAGALAVNLALAVHWQVDRWQRTAPIGEHLSALALEVPGTTLYGDTDLVAQALYEHPHLKLWAGLHQFDVSLFATIWDQGQFMDHLGRFPPHLLLLNTEQPVSLLRSVSFRSFTQRRYMTVVANKRRTYLLLKLAERY